MIVRGEETLKLSSTILPRLTTELACESKTSGKKKNTWIFQHLGPHESRLKLVPFSFCLRLKSYFRALCSCVNWLAAIDLTTSDPLSLSLLHLGQKVYANDFSFVGTKAGYFVEPGCVVLDIVTNSLTREFRLWKIIFIAI